MITLERFYGSGSHHQEAADAQYSRGFGRVVTYDFTSAGLSLKMPDAREYPHTGGPIVYVYNVGANDFDIEDADGGLISTVVSGGSCLLLLLDNTTSAGDWSAKCLGGGGGPSPSASSSEPPSTSVSTNIEVSSAEFTNELTQPPE